MTIETYISLAPTTDAGTLQPLFRYPLFTTEARFATGGRVGQRVDPRGGRNFPVFRDMRYASLNGSHPTAKRVRTLARAVASKEYGGDPKAPAAREKLREFLIPMPVDDLNVFAVMYMIVPVSGEMGATGKGGIWAMASAVVNEVALDVLKDRPMFEIVE